MENKKSTPATKLISLGLLTTIIFVILKLTETITWHWLWVVSPILIALILNLVVSLIKEIIEDFRK